MKQLLSFLITLSILAGMIPSSVLSMGAQKELTTMSSLTDATAVAAAPETASVWNGSTASGFARGDGTENRPYIIETAEQLAYLAYKVNNDHEPFTGQYFALANDIDLNKIDWNPIGSPYEIDYFAGHFNGSGYTIYGLKVYESSTTNYIPRAGLFGYTEGNIMNLNIVDAFIYLKCGSQIDVGILAGKCKNSTITNCHVSGEIKVGIDYYYNNYIGGLCGSVYLGTIRDCTSDVEISVTNLGNARVPHVGGLAGQASESLVQNCKTSGEITVTDLEGTCAGGAFGYLEKGNVYTSYSTANVNVTGNSYSSHAGGFVGLQNETVIHYSYATGAVSCSVSTDNEEEESYAGGLVGFSSGALNLCYAGNASVKCTYTNVLDGADAYAGKLCGGTGENHSVTSCYANKDMSIERTYYIAATTGCDAEPAKNGVANTANCTAESGTFSYSGDNPRAYLGWTLYNVQTGNGGVWIDTGNDPELFTEYCVGVTIRCIYEGQIINLKHVKVYPGQNVSIETPPLSDLNRDYLYVAGPFYEDTVFDATYSRLHVPGPPATCTEPQICYECGIVLEEAHHQDTTLIESTEATCTESGYVAYGCNRCRTVMYYEGLTPPLGHDLDSTFRCRVCAKQFSAPLTEYAIYVLDVETERPISGAKVTLGDQTVISGENGCANFQIENKLVTTLQVQADTYPTFVNTQYILGNLLTDYIFLSSKESDIHGAWCNGDNVLNGDSQINAQAHRLKAKIVVNGQAKANILRYELIQDNIIIATSTSGQFEVSNAYFKIGKDVYVRMHTSGVEGHNVFRRKLNINVVGYSFDFATELENLLPFGAGVNLSFPDGVPVFGGASMQFPGPFTKNDKINVMVKNDHVIVTYGIDKDYEDDPTLQNKTKKQIFQKIVDDWTKSKKVDKSREIHGSLALIIEFSPEGVTKVYGQINVGFHLEFSAGKTFVLGFIPVYGQVKMSLDGDLEITDLGYDLENASFMVPSYDAKLEGSIDLFAGVGCHIASVGVYGQLGLQLEFSDEQQSAFEKFRLWGEMGLYAKVKILFFKELCYKYPLFHGEKTWPEHMSVSRMLLYSIDEYTQDTREYLTNRTGWLNISTMSRDSTLVFLQDSTYTAIQPQIVTCGDTTMMLFMDDDGSDGLNYQHLYFSLYNKASGGWSDPQKVDDNLHSDTEFDVYADESGIYIAYAELATIAEEEQDDYAKILGTSEIAVAKYSFAEGRFVDHTYLTSNDTLDTTPTISGTADGITVAWVNNFTNDIFAQNANNSILISTLTDGVWSQEKLLAERGATVVSMDVGVLEGSAYVAMVQDVDCDLGTVDDRNLCLLDMDGNFTQIPMEDNQNDGVRFARMEGTDLLMWYNNSNLYSLSSVSATPAPMFAYPVEGLTGEYRFLQVDTHSYAVLFTKNELIDDGTGNGENGSNIYGVFYNNGAWGSPISITQNEPGYYVDAYDVCMTDGKMVIPYINAETTFTEEDIVKTTSFLSTTFELQNDLVAGEAEYTPSELFEGSEIEIRVPFTNNSWQTLTGVSCYVKDSIGISVMQSIMGCYVESGETSYITIVLPRDKLVAGREYSIHLEAPYQSEKDLSNNVSPLSLWYTDFSAEGAQVILGSKQELQYSVTNQGNIIGDATLEIYYLAEDGTKNVLHTELITSLGIGETFASSVAITDAFFAGGTDKSTIFLSVIPEKEELYQFNNATAISVKKPGQNHTTEVESPKDVLANPVIAEPFVQYDQTGGQNLSIPVAENGWSFEGVAELSEQDYRYENGVLTLYGSYLQTLEKGYYHFTLLYSNGDKSTEILLLLETVGTQYLSADLSAADQSFRYDGNPLELGKDILYSTESDGTVTAQYSADGGITWNAGLPMNSGMYLVEISVAQDDANKFYADSCRITVTVEKGTRAISVPKVTGVQGLQLLFGNSAVTAGKSDGQILYGYSLTDDVSTVEEWFEYGVLPVAQMPTTYYLFAKIVGGTQYEDAYSLSLKAEAHVHDYIGAEVPPTTYEEGYTLYTCYGCQHQYADNFVDKLAYLYGDANGDGMINTKDIILIRRYIEEKDPVTGVSSVEVIAGADANGDGSIDHVDLDLVRQYVTHKNPTTGESSVILGPTP